MERKLIVDALREVLDPELGIDIVTLGLIYNIKFDSEGNVDVDMTLTFAGCPLAQLLINDAKTKVEGVDGVKNAKINLVFEPQWNQSMVNEDNYKELLKENGSD